MEHPKIRCVCEEQLPSDLEAEYLHPRDPRAPQPTNAFYDIRNNIMYATLDNRTFMSDVEKGCQLSEQKLGLPEGWKFVFLHFFFVLFSFVNLKRNATTEHTHTHTHTHTRKHTPLHITQTHNNQLN